MNITKVTVRRVSQDKLKALASITIDDDFVVHSLRVVDGEKGLFVAMPSRKTSTGEFRDVAHPLNTETRQKIQETVLQEYEKTLKAEGAPVSTLKDEEEVEEA
ncbi:MAG: septation regulator SpoVG [Candidatus Subteraquimicrobiales bacterium]|nr:septation regulator SpoVG [Candidatus Subteraquimicrobiales bacterium]